MRWRRWGRRVEKPQTIKIRIRIKIRNGIRSRMKSKSRIALP